MCSYTEEEIIEEFMKLGEIQTEVERTGNVKKGNRAVDKMVKIFAYLKRNKEIAQKTLSKLICFDNAQTRAWAAACCLSFGLCTEEAVATLEQIGTNKQFNPVFRFSAKMTLEQWKKGELVMYQGQNNEQETCQGDAC